MKALCTKFLAVSKVQAKHFLLFHILLALFLVSVTSLIFGINNLDSIASSYVLERYVALIGIILFTPLFYPESNKSISEVVESKHTFPAFVYLSRLIIAAAAVFVLTAAIILYMLLNACTFDIISCFFGTISSALLLGALGFAAYSISDNIVVGYMVPIFYYILNTFKGDILGPFYLFSLSQNSFREKYMLFFSAFALFLTGIIYRAVKAKLR